jgi:catechol 2,3-dioxygenase-like lactoylglutathione lyase family enzyme
MKTDKGFSHIGLATHDIEATRAFYEGILGFPVIAFDTIEVNEGGRVRHMLFNVGRDQLIAFMEPRDVPGIPRTFDTSLFKSLGVPSGFYHIAFEAATEAGLTARRELLKSRGYEVGPISRHDWAISFYFMDPVNGLPLEFCCWTREWTEKDRLTGDHFRQSLAEFEVTDFTGVHEERRIGERPPPVADPT